MPGGCAAGDRSRAIPGTLTRYSSASAAYSITFGARWTSTEWFSTSLCRIGGTARQPSVSSNDCYMDCGTSRDASSRMACAAMVSLIDRSCLRSDITPAGICTIVQRIRIDPRDDESDRCRSSNRAIKPSDFCRHTPRSTDTSGHDVTSCLRLVIGALGQGPSGSGERRPVSTDRHDTLRSPSDRSHVPRHALTWQCPGRR